MSDPAGYKNDLTTAAAFMSDAVRVVERMTRGLSSAQRVEMLRRVAPIELRAAARLLEADEGAGGDWLLRAAEARLQDEWSDTYEAKKRKRGWAPRVFKSMERGRKYQ